MKFKVLYRYKNDLEFHTESGESILVRHAAEELDTELTADEAKSLLEQYILAFDESADV